MVLLSCSGTGCGIYAKLASGVARHNCPGCGPAKRPEVPTSFCRSDNRRSVYVALTAQVRQLSPDESKLSRPVHLRGQVTALSAWKDSFFFEDKTGGISVDRQDGGSALDPGDEVEITGETGPGLFAPVLISRQITRIGQQPLPPAPLRRFDELVGGQQDSQWVEVRGTVRSASIISSWGQQVLLLELDLGGAPSPPGCATFTSRTRNRWSMRKSRWAESVEPPSTSGGSL